MDLNKLCELLGFEWSCPMVEADDGEIGFYGHLVFDTHTFTTGDAAVEELQNKLEQMVADIIRVNRNLSNEQLAEILLNKEKND